MITYNYLTEDCFFHPEHAAQPTVEPRGIKIQTSGNTEEVILYLWADSSGLISRALFKARGNPYVIAGAEWICRKLQGTPIEEHPNFDYRFLAEQFEMPKSQYPAALVLEEAYIMAVRLLKEDLKGK